MNKALLFISLLFTTLYSFAQSFTIESGAIVSIDEDASLQVEDISVDGSIQNHGELYINQRADFAQNREIGAVTFAGDQVSVISGKILRFTSFIANSSAQIILTSDSIFTEKLSLQQGVIVTGFSHLESNEEVSGGSSDSYIDGTFTVKRGSTGVQHFPVGKNGLYNPISLSSVAAGSVTSVKINIPEEGKLIPGDSLIGINKQFEWQIDYKGTPSLSTPSIEFQGIDLTDLPNKVAIKAPIYIPSVVQFDDINNIYKNLGSRSIENTDNTTFGAIQANKTIKLSLSPVTLSIGLSPTTDKLHFYVPNFFSPNSKLDENKVFRPFLTGTEISKLDIRIWDQYNRLVFRENYLNPDMNLIGWNGENEPEGTYFYTIVLESEEGNYERKGTVFLGR